MKILISAAFCLALTASAFGQCGSFALNPITHKLDCVGTAAGGITITSPNGSITVGGTAVAPTLDTVSGLNGHCTMAAGTSCTITGLTGVVTKAVVSCYDTSGTTIPILPNDFGSSTADTLVINFSAPQTGYCNASTGVGATGATGSSAFSALTSSTNSTATMHVGTGASLDATGSGAIVATKLGSVSGIQTFSSGTPGATVAADVVGLFSTCSGTQYLGADGACHSASGSVTSIATTTPITGGTITATGTIACATCVTSSSPGAGIAHFAGSTQAVTSSAVSLTADVTGILPAANGGTGIANSKTLTVSNNLTLAGTDATVMTFPTTSATIARTDAAQSFTGVQTFVAPILGTPTSATLTNATGLPAAAVVAGTFGTGNYTVTGNLTVSGILTSGSGSGVAGVLDLTQGTLPTFSPANTFSLYAPTSIGTSYQWRIPAADAAGAIVSDGAGTPGLLSIVAFNGTGNILKSAGAAAVATGKTITVSNSLTLAGTDSTTMTFPSTSATIARTDATNTFTGNQTINGNVTFTDNTYDIGAAGATRPRSIYTTASIITGNLIQFGGTGGGNPRIGPEANSTMLHYFAPCTTFASATVGCNDFNGSTLTATSGNQSFMNLTETFAPTSGSATFAMFGMNPTINQTGGASGITRGIYFNPTITAAADFRALEFGNVGATQTVIKTGTGIVQLGVLTTTGAATGKTVVCVDTATGILYASTSGVACAN